MAFYRNKVSYLKNESGQSTVEYILLLAVVATVVFAIFKSEGFNKLFGENGQIVQRYKQQFEFSYRHGFFEMKEDKTPDYSSGDHESYQGRFFSAKDPYP